MTRFFGLSFEHALDRAGVVFLLVQGVLLGVATAAIGQPV